MAGGSYGSLPIMLCTFTRLLLKLNGRDPGGLVFLVQLDAQAPTSGPEVFWVEKPLQVTADDFKRLYRHNFTCGSSWKLTLRGFFFLKYWRLWSFRVVAVLHQHQSDCCSLLRNIHACASTKKQDRNLALKTPQLIAIFRESERFKINKHFNLTRFLHEKPFIRHFGPTIENIWIFDALDYVNVHFSLPAIFRSNFEALEIGETVAGVSNTKVDWTWFIAVDLGLLCQ